MYYDSKSIMKFLTHWTTAFITLFVITFIGLQDYSFKETLRLKSFDYMLANEEISQSQDITIITIDEEAIEKYGQWPWPRDVLAHIILELRNVQTGIIVMPILFSEPDRFDGDWVFCEALEMGTVIAQTGTTQKRTSNPVSRGVAKIGNPLDYLFEWPGMVGPDVDLAVCADNVYLSQDVLSKEEEIFRRWKDHRRRVFKDDFAPVLQHRGRILSPSG